MDKMIFMVQSMPGVKGADLVIDQIGVDVKAPNPRELVRMLGMAMEKYQEIRIGILSAAVSYINEHNLTFEDLMKNRM